MPRLPPGVVKKTSAQSTRDYVDKKKQAIGTQVWHDQEAKRLRDYRANKLLSETPEEAEARKEYEREKKRRQREKKKQERAGLIPSTSGECAAPAVPPSNVVTPNAPVPPPAPVAPAPLAVGGAFRWRGRRTVVEDVSPDKEVEPDTPRRPAAKEPPALRRIRTSG